MLAWARARVQQLRELGLDGDPPPVSTYTGEMVMTVARIADHPAP